MQSQIERLPPVFRQHSDKVIAEWKWSAETVSLCFDIGIYFAKVFQLRYDNVKWTYVTEPEDYIYRNKPVLEGFRVHMSPYNLVLIWEAKISEAKGNFANELKRLYDVWAREHTKLGQTTGVYVKGKERWTP